MKEQKRVLTMSAYEYRLALYGLIHFRNQLLVRTPLSEITSTGEIEQSLRLN